MAGDRVYTLDQLDELEEMNEENVTPEHLALAMDHVVRLLEVSNIPYAVMGGMHMIIRGYDERSTTDVDIAVQSNARDILQALASDRRQAAPSIRLLMATLANGWIGSFALVFKVLPAAAWPVSSSPPDLRLERTSTRWLSRWI